MVSLQRIRIVVSKSLKVQLVQYKLYLALYLSPLAILLFLIFYQNIATQRTSWHNLDPLSKQLGMIPPCKGQQCKTLVYSVVGHKQPYIDSVIGYVKQQNNISDDLVEEWKLSPGQIMDRLAAHPNKTQAIVIFCTSSWKIGNLDIPCTAEDHHMNFYTIVFNLSLFFRTPYLGNMREAYPKDPMVVRLKQNLDEGIIKYYLNSTADFQFAEYPNKGHRFVTGVNIVFQYGGFFFLLPYLIAMLMEVSTLLKEKDDKLRIGLSIVGVSAIEFHVANLVVAFINNMAISISFCLFGFILDFAFFVKGLLWFNIVLLVANGMATTILGFLVVAVVKDKMMGMTVASMFVLYSIIMMWLFTGGFLLYFLYKKGPESLWVTSIRRFFNMYPSFYFSKIFSDIERRVDKHFDSFESRWVEGNSLIYQDLFMRTEGTLNIASSEHYSIPSIMQSFGNLLVCCLFYLVLVWYFDNIIESNRGKAEHPFFFLKKSYWSGRMINSQFYNKDSESIVEVRNILKHYRKYPMGITSSEDVFALKGATFEVEPREIVSLLGRNGAGKSTLIGILTGVLELDSGSVKICNLNVQNQIDAIRRRLGVCPQFDILWDELTAYQHLQLFGRLKGLQNLEAEIDKCLADVSLLRNKHGRIKTFSGGMKRRVSLAISFMGRPDLIILDEPTTGMDPKVRKLCWNVIRKLKSHSSIILTTHDMEEADCLSDRIMVMSSGRILAQGSSMYLKKQFGSGYSLRIISKDAVKLKAQLVGQGVMNCMIDDQVVVIQSTRQAQLVDVLVLLQQIKSELISEWLISECSLEEVFLNVNKKY